MELGMKLKYFILQRYIRNLRKILLDTWHCMGPVCHFVHTRMRKEGDFYAIDETSA